MFIGPASIFTLVGSGAGIYSFLRLFGGDLRNWWRRPRLVIEFNSNEDLRTWELTTGSSVVRHQKVATVHIRNIRKTVALRCVGMLKLIEGPQNPDMDEEFTLHWADVDYSQRTMEPEPIAIGPERRRLDVAFTTDIAHQPGGLRFLSLFQIH